MRHSHLNIVENKEFCSRIVLAELVPINEWLEKDQLYIAL